MHKPWLRAEDAWSGEREPGGYLHGPWPKFWVEPERRDEFVADQRCPSHGLGLAPLHRDRPAGRARRSGAERYHELRYEDLVRQPLDEAEKHPRLPRHRARSSRATPSSPPRMRADDSSVGTWRSTFYPSELAEIDAEAGDLLRQLGYDDD